VMSWPTNWPCIITTTTISMVCMTNISSTNMRTMITESTSMDELMLRALIGAVALAVALGPLGSFVVWRQMAYFGDTIAHAALLGVAISIISGVVPLTVAIFIVAVAVALALNGFTRDARFHADTVLGLLAHGTLALGVLLVRCRIRGASTSMRICS